MLGEGEVAEDMVGCGNSRVRVIDGGGGGGGRVGYVCFGREKKGVLVEYGGSMNIDGSELIDTCAAFECSHTVL